MKIIDLLGAEKEYQSTSESGNSATWIELFLSFIGEYFAIKSFKGEQVS